MDIYKIHEILRNARRVEFENSEQLSLGELIKLLEDIKDKTTEVHYAFCDFYIDGLDSYRGAYSELALGYSKEHVEGQVTVSEILELLKSAIGKTFEGYKGGDFLMDENTPIWVANYGNWSQTAIVGVTDGVYVYIETKHIE